MDIVPRDLPRILTPRSRQELKRSAFQEWEERTHHPPEGAHINPPLDSTKEMTHPSLRTDGKREDDRADRDRRGAHQWQTEALPQRQRIQRTSENPCGT